MIALCTVLGWECKRGKRALGAQHLGWGALPCGGDGALAEGAQMGSTFFRENVVSTSCHLAPSWRAATCSVFLTMLSLVPTQHLVGTQQRFVE